MAIAGLVITVEEGTDINQVLSQQENIVDVELSHDTTKVVAVLEVSSDRLQKEIEEVQKCDGIIAVDIAYINYEDDIEKEGGISCPVHISKVKTT